MNKYYLPPQITKIALSSESHLLEESMQLKGSNYGFNKDNSSADWLGNKKENSNDIWEHMDE